MSSAVFSIPWDRFLGAINVEFNEFYVGLKLFYSNTAEVAYLNVSILTLTKCILSLG
jgi:hypothetical protein